MISEAAPQSVIGLPAAEHPLGLPVEWSDYPLEGQAAYLRSHALEVPLSTYVSVGLEVGARRMDARTQGGKAAFYTETLVEQSFSSTVTEAYYAGQNGDDEREYTGVNESVLAEAVREHFDVPLVVPVIFHDVCGRSRMTGSHLKGKAKVGVMPLKTMVEAGWENSLLALAAAQRMTQSASKAARESPGYALGPIDEIPRVAKDYIDTFWQNKLAGRNPGAAYYMGYHAMARATTLNAMKERWNDDDYADTRQTFITAINMSTSHWKVARDRAIIWKKVGVPAFKSIRDGDFANARARLARAATDDPNLFTSIGLRHLLGPDQGSISGHDMLK